MRSLLGLSILALPAWAAAAEPPRFELAAGYALLATGDESLHGWQAATDWNATPWLALALELSGQYGGADGVDLSSFSYLAGPRVSWRGHLARPFAHALFGGVRRSAGLEVLGVSITEADTAFGGALGGGVDVALGASWALRVQGDWLFASSEAETTGDGRFGAGVVWRPVRR